ncbi:MAG: hypothetical protein ACNA78_00900 [Balneolaceae bacterium]
MKKVLKIGIVMSLLMLSCAGEQEQEETVFIYTNEVDIRYGNDHCSFTGDAITTVRYGGKIAMNNGTEHKFMSVECMAGYYLGMQEKAEIKTMETVDFAHGQKFIPVEKAVYLKSSLRPSPNGLNLTAVDDGNEKMKQYIYDAYPGEYLSWNEVLDHVKAEWNLQ